VKFLINIIKEKTKRAYKNLSRNKGSNTTFYNSNIFMQPIGQTSMQINHAKAQHQNNV
jgi:hypothetical protein